MKILFFLIAFYAASYALEVSDRLFDCTEIFKERKSELLVELERIDEQKQALTALKIATEDLLKKKENKLSQQEEIVNEKLAKIEQKEANIKKMLDEKRKILAELTKTKMSKIAQTYAKMKPAAASAILADMSLEDSVKILQSLKPKVIGKILTKMDAKKASQLTRLLSK